MDNSMKIKFLAIILFFGISSPSFIAVTCKAMNAHKAESIIEINENTNEHEDFLIKIESKKAEPIHKRREQLKAHRSVRWSAQQKKASRARAQVNQIKRAKWKAQAEQEALEEAKIHIPLCIFMDDESENESPLKEEIYPISHDVINALNTKTIPIIVSHSLLHNIIYRKRNNTNSEVLSNISLLNADWDLFLVPETQLLLALPKTLNQQQKDYFNTEPLEDLTHLLPIDGHADEYEQLLHKILAYKDLFPNGLPFVEAYDFKNIFNAQKIKHYNPIWDIFLSGHGYKLEAIADLPLDVFTDLLTFFDTNLTVGVVMVSSCYAGGVNLQVSHRKIDINQNLLPYKLHFPYIVASVGEMGTSGRYDFKTLMEYAKHIKTFDKTALNNLLSTLHASKNELLQSHRNKTIPQIILPGGIKIQTLYPDDDITIIGKVFLKKHERENKPIITYGKVLRNKQGTLSTQTKNGVKNILIYPARINVPLEIKPILGQDDAVNLINFDLRTLPNAQLLLDKASKTAWSDRKKGLQNWLTFSKTHASNLSHLYSYADSAHQNASKKEKSKEPLIVFKTSISELFPALLSMIHRDTTHFIQEIILNDTQGNYAQGKIIDFIRHALLNQKHRESTKKFIIDQLTGKNDLNLTLEALRVNLKNPDLHPLETTLRKIYGEYPDTIVLEKLIVETTGEVDPETLEATGKCSIKFMLKDGSVWELKHNFKNPPAIPWNFQEYDANEHLKVFEQLKHKIPE